MDRKIWTVGEKRKRPSSRLSTKVTADSSESPPKEPGAVAKLPSSRGHLLRVRGGFITWGVSHGLGEIPWFFLLSLRKFGYILDDKDGRKKNVITYYVRGLQLFNENLYYLLWLIRASKQFIINFQLMISNIFNLRFVENFIARTILGLCMSCTKSK